MPCITRGPAGAAVVLLLALLIVGNAAAAESSGPADAAKSAKAESEQHADAGKKKPSHAKHANSKSARKPKHKTTPSKHAASAPKKDGEAGGEWASRYNAPGLRLDYPTMDDALLGVLVGSPDPGGSKPPAREKNGKIEPVLGDVVRREDEPAPTVTPMTPVGPLSTPAGITTAGTPDQAPPLTADERKYADLYRKTDPTRGWTGPKQRVDYVPMQAEVEQPNRWRIGAPDYKQHPRTSAWDPYGQNVLKADYPIIGDRIFFNFTGESTTLVEERHLPTPSNIPALNPGSFGIFGRPGQHAFRQDIRTSFQLFNGDAGFEPPLWQLKVTPVFNLDNDIRLQELGDTNPDVRTGFDRRKFDVGIQELFAEVRMAITSPFFDFVSLRVGRQFFSSDFRGFIFVDENRGIRVFGNGASNRNSYNVAFFDMLEHETNSGLLRENSPDRGQKVFIANFFRQDFLDIPGYTAGISYHGDHDDPSFFFDQNGFLVRPDPVGRFKPHQVDAHYIGLVGDGHIGRINVDHAFYQVLGRDSFNELANKPVDLDGQMAALELSIDYDWIRYKISGFYASGTKDPSGNTARGFDSIIDDPNFACGPFSFWVHQGIGLQGVQLKSPGSLLPDLRASKLEGQAQFNNPGIQLIGVGTDLDITPKVKALINVNLLRFDRTEALQLFIFQGNIPRGIGLDYSLGVEYRPDLNQNIVAQFGVAGFTPGDGFTAIYETDKGLYQAFTELKLQF